MAGEIRSAVVETDDELAALADLARQLIELCQSLQKVYVDVDHTKRSIELDADLMGEPQGRDLEYAKTEPLAEAGSAL